MGQERVDSRAIYALALEEGRTSLREQAESLERLRSRATGFVATVLGVVGLVADSIGTTRGTRAQDVAAFVSIGGAIATAVFAGAVLAPRSFTFTMKAETLAGPEWQVPEAEKELATYLGEHATANEARLTIMHQLFLCEIIAGAISIGSLLVQGAL